MVWAAVDESSRGFWCARLALLTHARCLEPARTWLPATVCLVGNSSPPSEAPRQTRPARRCPGAARAAKPLPVLGRGFCHGPVPAARLGEPGGTAYRG